MTSEPRTPSDPLTPSIGGRPRNDPGPLGWNPCAAQYARLDALASVRSIAERLAAEHGIHLSERAIDGYFLPKTHANARPPRAAVADAIAQILGVDRLAIGLPQTDANA